MEGDFVNTVLSILLLEGIGRQLDPDLDLFKSALPILRQLGRQMGTREAIEHVKGRDLGAMLKVCEPIFLDYSVRGGADALLFPRSGYGWRQGSWLVRRLSTGTHLCGTIGSRPISRGCYLIHYFFCSLR